MANVFHFRRPLQHSKRAIACMPSLLKLPTKAFHLRRRHFQVQVCESPCNSCETSSTSLATQPSRLCILTFIAPSEALHTQTGQKDGQQLLIRENDGSVTAHLWSSSTGQWNLVSCNTLISCDMYTADKMDSDRYRSRRRRYRYSQEGAQWQGV